MESFLKIAIPGVSFFLTTLVGLDLSTDGLSDLLRRSRALWVGVITPLVVVPLLAWGTVHLFRLPAGLAASFLLTAACPAGTMAGVHAYLARANTALALALVGCSSLLSSLTLPGFLWLFSQGATPAFLFPWKALVLHVTLLLVLPVAIGMTVRRAIPAQVEAYRKPLRGIGATLLLALVAVIVISDPRAFGAGLAVSGPVTLFTLAALLAGDAIGRLGGLAPQDRIAMVLHLPVRNLGIASAIAIGVLQRLEYAAFAAAFFVLQTTLLLLAVAFYPFGRSHGSSNAVGEAPRAG
jgi:BASS family bile acid:Na+ symporter